MFYEKKNGQTEWHVIEWHDLLIAFGYWYESVGSQIEYMQAYEKTLELPNGDMYKFQNETNDNPF